MPLLNFVFIKLTLCLIIGILFGYFFNINLLYLISISIVLLLFLVFDLISTKTLYKKRFWAVITIYLTCISCGCLSITAHKEYNFKNHYTKLLIKDKDSSLQIGFRIREVLKPGNFHNKYVIDILSLDSIKVSGRSLLNIVKDSMSKPLKADDILLVKTPFKELISPLNPYQFDYKAYLKKQHIYHQLFISNTEIYRISNKKHSLLGYASLLREKINNKLKKYRFKPEELAIINALLLGQRQDISKEIYDSYTQAGAIHILAVSGLHVGVFLFLLNFLLKPIEYLKRGSFYKTILLVIILWSFAVIAGLSASVIRAVTMFTVVAIAINWKRPTNVYNTLTISMFILLLCKPTFLFDVGFQLSYLAVFAIVAIKPLLDKLWYPKLKATRFFWNIFTVTVSAQFGIIPLSLYYFHQFPGLFFVSNLVIIPFLGLILGLGVIVIGLSMTNLLPNFIADIFGFIISIMNQFITWVASQESFLFQNISFDLIHVLISYSIIILFFLIIKTKSFKSVISLLLVVIISQSILLFEKEKKADNSFIVFHKSRHSIIGYKTNRHLQIYINIKDSSLVHDKTITNYKVGSHIKTTSVDSINTVYVFNNRKLLVVDSLGAYKTVNFKPNIILLQHSPKINLERLIERLQPELIISDGSNYKSYQERWKITCERKKIPFHRTSEKGAFLYVY